LGKAYTYLRSTVAKAATAHQLATDPLSLN